eukprot:jgi/Orpsp1_1/1189810/evm.model.d7180000074656.1
MYMDHKNLTFPRKPELLSQRQIRWYEFLSRFDFKLIYRAGKKSGKPDILSRRSDHLFACVRSISCVVNFCNFQNDSLISTIYKSLKNDELYNKIVNFLNDDKIKESPIRNIDKISLDKDGFLLFNNLIYVPKDVRIRVLELHHDSVSAGHFGVNKTIELISRNF